MTSSSPIYHQKLTLGARQIRKLVIEEGQGDEPIVTKLVKGNIEDDDYTVFSYCWGQPADKTQRITVNGHPFSIRNNALNALRALRTAVSPTTVWIDEICIDQSSDDDTTQQLEKMGRLYAKAKVVVVWLGELESDKCPIETLRGFAQDPGAHWDISLKPSLKALNVLFTHPWFRRTWTFFEAVTANSTLLYQSSRGVFSAEELDGFLSSFYHHFESMHCCAPASSGTVRCPG
jgi:hypothetical protein